MILQVRGCSLFDHKNQVRWIGSGKLCNISDASGLTFEFAGVCGIPTSSHWTSLEETTPIYSWILLLVTLWKSDLISWKFLHHSKPVLWVDLSVWEVVPITSEKPNHFPMWQVFPWGTSSSRTLSNWHSTTWISATLTTRLFLMTVSPLMLLWVSTPIRLRLEKHSTWLVLFADHFHVLVSGIEYGAEAICKFEKVVQTYSEKEELEGRLNVAIKSIPLVDIHGSGRLDLNDDLQRIGSDLRVRFVSDFPISNSPTNFEDAVRTFRNISNIFCCSSTMSLRSTMKTLSIGLIKDKLRLTSSYLLLRDLRILSLSPFPDFIHKLENLKKS